jgi:glycosyltransferase involved in cell wall biosynthesis
MTTPSVSVVIPAYNAAEFLAEALESVLAQTRPAREIVVVDDGSTDDTAAVASRYAPRVTVISQRNKGESAARNLALSQVSGDWVAWLDADDIWEPTKLEAQTARVDEAAADLVCVFCGFSRFGPGAPDEIVIPGDENFSPAEHLVHWRLHPSTAIVQRRSSPRFAEWTRDAEDLLYFADLSSRGTFAAVAAPLVRVRSSMGQQTRSPAHIVGTHASRWRWATESGLFSDRELEEIRRHLDAHLLEQMRLSKWKRDWRRYWTIRQYLASKRPELRRKAELREFIGPSWAYSLKDEFDRLVSGAGRAEGR